MADDLKQSILCPTKLDNMIIEGSDSNTIDGLAAPGHIDYVELIINRCQRSIKSNCDENDDNLFREMRKIHFALAIIEQQLDLSKVTEKPLSYALKPVSHF